MLATLRRLHSDLRAALTRYFRAREVVSVLKQNHVRELAETPVMMWAVKKAEHAKEIASVKAGNFDIIDRRSIAFPYVPQAVNRLHLPIMKNTPWNLRRFSETPIPRRAINLIKNGVLSLDWRVKAGEDYDENDPDILKRIKIAQYSLHHPNNTDSWRTLIEAVVEDFLIGGYGTIEPQLTPHYERPFKLWAADGSTIQIYGDWTESDPDKPHYAQMTGLRGEYGIITFLDDELLYLRDNVRSNTPFGLGKIEACFNSINALLGAQDAATRAAADQVHKTWMWWKTTVPPAQQQEVRRHLVNEAEGQSKISMMSGMPEPTVLDINAVKPEDLLIDWQQFLIRIIASGCDLSAMSLGIENDVNRSTSEVLSDMDFNSAVVPVAKKLAEAITRFILHKLLGWKDLEFEFLGLDDPDIMMQWELYSGLYRANSATPDELRNVFQSGPPLPSGWGRLTLAQQQLVLVNHSPKPAFGAPPFGGKPGSGSGAPNAGGAAPPKVAAASLHTSPFVAEDVAKMTPQVVEGYRTAGLLPDDNAQLMQEMEEQKPGILEEISDELMEFFEKVDDESGDSKPKPAKVSGEDEAEQQKRYRKFRHITTPEEVVSMTGPALKQKKSLTRNSFRGKTTLKPH